MSKTTKLVSIKKRNNKVQIQLLLTFHFWQVFVNVVSMEQDMCKLKKQQTHKMRYLLHWNIH